MSMNIRNENSLDIDVIDSVTIEAFLNAPHTDHTEQFVVKALRDSAVLTLSLVAEVDGIVVGHVAVSPVSISDQTQGWFGLGPVSVLPQYQGAGVGSKLIRQALAALKLLQAGGCVLLWEPSYYCRFGFKPEARLILAGVPAEYFQAIVLNGSLPEGEVHYHEAFNAKS